MNLLSAREAASQLGFAATTVRRISNAGSFAASGLGASGARTKAIVTICSAAEDITPEAWDLHYELELIQS